MAMESSAANKYGTVFDSVISMALLMNEQLNPEREKMVQNMALIIKGFFIAH
jgi:hypothetical protein